VARKKEPPKPLFSIKHDFYESLDHALLQVINLMQAVDQAIDLEQVKPGPVLDLLRDRSRIMRAALMQEGE
jgi:hypothetical protein